MKKTHLFAVLSAAIAAVVLVGTAHAQKGLGLDLPDPGDLPKPVVDYDELYDYEVEFAGAPQTGYMMINDRGVERGPYDSYDEAHEAGMQTPWVYFWVDRIEYQTWYSWRTFDTHYEARQEADWLRGIGFWARINEIPELRLRKESFGPLRY